MTAPPAASGGLNRATDQGRASLRSPHTHDPQLEETVHMEAKVLRAKVAADAKATVVGTLRTLGDGSVPHTGPKTRTGDYATPADAPRKRGLRLQHSQTTRGARVNPDPPTSRSVKRPDASTLLTAGTVGGIHEDLGGWDEVDISLADEWSDRGDGIEDVLAASGLGRRNLYWLVGLLVIAAGGVTAALILT